MEVILQSTYKTLGKQGEIVTVKPGYGRNYLIPKGIAIVANRSNKKSILAYHEQVAHKQSQLKEHAEATLLLIKKCTITIKVKVGKEGSLFGSVTPLQISKSLKEQGIAIDYTQIHLSETIKKLGKYQAEVRLHEEVSYLLHFDVIEG